MGGRYLEAGDGVRQRAGNDCGPAALAHALRRLGLGVPYPDGASVVRLRPRGCGFEDLAREAARHGVLAAHRRMRPAEPGLLPAPSILFLRQGHFVVLEGRDASGRYVVHDPALGRVAFSGGALGAAWSGDVLVFLGGAGVPGGAPLGPGADRW
jgi:ATP-binding cassette subfamily B protein